MFLGVVVVGKDGRGFVKFVKESFGEMWRVFGIGDVVILDVILVEEFGESNFDSCFIVFNSSNWNNNYILCYFGEFFVVV